MSRRKVQTTNIPKMNKIHDIKVRCIGVDLTWNATHIQTRMYFIFKPYMESEAKPCVSSITWMGEHSS